MPHFIGWEGPAPAATIEAGLVSAGLEVARGVPDEADSAVLVVASVGAAVARLSYLAQLLPGRVLALANGRLRSADHWALLQAGASDVLGASVTAAEVVARLARWRQVDEVVERVRGGIVGSSASLLHALRTVVEAACFTDAPILLTGQSGTGKELVARLVHEVRRVERGVAGDLVLLDCSTIVPDLAGSEFFGHERGAYTGAVGPRDGAFARADGGTLFLDEVGELPLQLQPELLRAVQEGMFKRVGGNTWRRARFGLVCATHRELPAEVAAGRFREDLFFRVSAWSCRVPSLEERRADILPLARHFLRQTGSKVDLSDEVGHYLEQRRYPGNVRELQQLVGRMAGRHAGGGSVTLGDIPSDDRPSPSDGDRWPDDRLRRSLDVALTASVSLEQIKREVADVAVALALERCGHRTGEAAELLGVSPRALQQRRARQSAG
jgi:transcriptional regulator with GAF, ATPase, and Fis domain